MRAVTIGADGWVQGIDLDTGDHRASHPATVALWHNLDLWYRDSEATVEREPNMAAMAFVLAASDLDPADLPFICGDAIVVAVDPQTADPTAMTTPQYQALSYALLSSLAA